MTYAEVEEVLRHHGHHSTIEQLRSAVGEEARELKNGLKGELDEALAVEQARELFAEDISRWINDGGDPDPQSLIGMRARYSKSWAFAQIIHNLLMIGADELDVPELDADTIIRICLANAELGTRLVEVSRENHKAYQASQMAASIEVISKIMDHERAPTYSENGIRKLALCERLEALIEMLKDEPAAQESIDDRLAMACKNMRWMAQSIHQVNHEVMFDAKKPRNGDSWMTCDRGVCGSMENMLAEIGFNKQGEPL